MLGKQTQDRPATPGPPELQDGVGQASARALPSPCMRVRSVPSATCDGPACPGWQLDDTCICDRIDRANEQGADWRFQIDPDGRWVYTGDPLDIGAVGTAPVEAPPRTAPFPDPIRFPLADAKLTAERDAHEAAMRPDPFGPGTCAVTADEAGRFTQFAVSMQGLQLPAGSKTLWQVGNDIAGNRNRAVEDMLGDWVWFIDDDHAFSPDILARLLAHDLPIVAPLVLRRSQPFSTVMCIDTEIVEVNQLPHDSLVEVEQTGSSGMLIRREVLEAIEAPWFELQTGVSEDITFCQKARAAGFPIYVDTAIPLGHITTATIWPVWSAEEDKYMTGFTIADGFQITADITLADE